MDQCGYNNGAREKCKVTQEVAVSRLKHQYRLKKAQKTAEVVRLTQYNHIADAVQEGHNLSQALEFESEDADQQPDQYHAKVNLPG